MLNGRIIEVGVIKGMEIYEIIKRKILTLKPYECVVYKCKLYRLIGRYPDDMYINVNEPIKIKDGTIVLG